MIGSKAPNHPAFQQCPIFFRGNHFNHFNEKGARCEFRDLRGNEVPPSDVVRLSLATTDRDLWYIGHNRTMSPRCPGICTTMLDTNLAESALLVDVEGKGNVPPVTSRLEMLFWAVVAYVAGR